MKSIFSIGLVTYVTSTHLRGISQPTYQPTPSYTYVNPVGYSTYQPQPYVMTPSTIQSFMLNAGLQSLNDNANVVSNQNIIGTATASYGSNANTSTNNRNGAINYSNLVVSSGLDKLLSQANALKQLATPTALASTTGTPAIVTTAPVNASSIPATLTTTTAPMTTTTTVVQQPSLGVIA